jgi:ABC-type transporter Mla maintaining outer membrane lipid asymmetry ATPase subunit MlaF
LTSEYAVINEKGEVTFEKEGEKLCLINTKVLMLREGKIIFSGTDEELKRNQDPYIKRFIYGK